MPVATKVLKTVPIEQQEEFTKRCEGVADILEVFAAVLERQLKAHQAEAKLTDKYQMASWAYYQADSVGYQRALSDAITTLKIKE